jgi:hypothetical protein
LETNNKQTNKRFALLMNVVAKNCYVFVCEAVQASARAMRSSRAAEQQKHQRTKASSKTNAGTPAGAKQAKQASKQETKQNSA